ncbi:hypothetical protein Plhal304r1_c009g0036971 [Plasmopara halstedii]
MEQELLYSHATKPRPVQTKRNKAQNDSNKIAPVNIMHDPRILRGSMFASITASKFETKRETMKKRKSAFIKKRSNNYAHPVNLETRMGSSKAFTSISLDAHLIEEPASTLEYDSFSQTDAFLPRTAPTTSDNFILRRTGIEISTQIEESDRLFEYDSEVKPLLNVLVNKTLAQALQEVKEEREMKMLHCEHTILNTAISDEKFAERALEEKSKEAIRRKERIKDEKAEQLRCDQIMREKLVAWHSARPLVLEVINQANQTLQTMGVFYDPKFISLSNWLIKDVYNGINNVFQLRVLSTELLDDLLLHGLSRRPVLVQLPPNLSEVPTALNFSEGAHAE